MCSPLLTSMTLKVISKSQPLQFFNIHLSQNRNKVSNRLKIKNRIAHKHTYIVHTKTRTIATKGWSKLVLNADTICFVAVQSRFFFNSIYRIGYLNGLTLIKENIVCTVALAFDCKRSLLLTAVKRVLGVTCCDCFTCGAIP